MTKDEFNELLADKSEDWIRGFFAAVNLTNETKSAFLRGFIGEEVTVQQVSIGDSRAVDATTDTLPAK